MSQEQTSIQEIPKDRTIYVSVPEKIREQKVQELFSQFGQVQEIKHRTANNKKSLYIIYADPSSAKRALQQTGKLEIDGVTIRVNQYLEMSQLDQQANVWISELEPSHTESSIQEALKKYGRILSCKVKQDLSRQSKGIAYVQFETKDQADKCIQDQANHKLKVQKYQANKSKNPRERTTFYIRHIRANDKSLEELQKEITQYFSEFGQVESVKAQWEKHANNLGYADAYAFVVFKNQADAIEAMRSEKPFNGEKLQTNWYINSNNMESTLFTKNLKITVTEEQLKEEIAKADIAVDSVQIIRSQPSSYSNNTQKACIFLKSVEDGKKLLDEAIKRAEIRQLYVNQLVQMSPFMKKEDRQEFLEMKRNQRQKQMQSGFPPQYGLYPNVQYLPHFDPQHFHPQNFGPQVPYGGGYPQQPQNQPPRQPYQNQGGHEQRYGPRQQHQHHNPHPRRNQQAQLNLQELERLNSTGNSQKVRDLVGVRLFPQVQQISSQDAQYITGVLLNFENYSIKEMVQMTLDRDYLQEQVEEIKKQLSQDQGQ